MSMFCEYFGYYLSSSTPGYPMIRCKVGSHKIKGSLLGLRGPHISVTVRKDKKPVRLTFELKTGYDPNQKKREEIIINGTPYPKLGGPYGMIMEDLLEYPYYFPELRDAILIEFQKISEKYDPFSVIKDIKLTGKSVLRSLGALNRALDTKYWRKGVKWEYDPSGRVLGVSFQEKRKRTRGGMIYIEYIPSSMAVQLRNPIYPEITGILNYPWTKEDLELAYENIVKRWALKELT